MTEYPRVPAAFINAIAEEGTKAEAIEWLQKQWDETCWLREQLKGRVDGRVNIRAGEFSPEVREAIATAVHPHANSRLTFSGTDAHFLLFAMDNYLGVDANGHIMSAKHGYTREDLQSIRDRLFRAHKHPSEQDANE